MCCVILVCKVQNKTKQKKKVKAAFCAQNKACGQSAAFRLPALPSQQEPSPALLSQAAPSLPTLAGTPSVRLLPNRLFQDVQWFREALASKDEWRALAEWDELFCHIYNRRGSLWQPPSHRPTPLSEDGISNTWTLFYQGTSGGSSSVGIYLILMSSPFRVLPPPVIYPLKAGQFGLKWNNTLYEEGFLSKLKKGYRAFCAAHDKVFTSL